MSWRIPGTFVGYTSSPDEYDAFRHEKSTSWTLGLITYNTPSWVQETTPPPPTRRHNTLASRSREIRGDRLSSRIRAVLGDKSLIPDQLNHGHRVEWLSNSLSENKPSRRSSTVGMRTSIATTVEYLPPPRQGRRPIQRTSN